MPEPDAPLEVSRLRAGEITAAAWVLARAFRDNPMNRAVMSQHSPRARLRKNEPRLRTQLHLARRHGLVLAARQRATVVGILVAASPRGYPFPLPPLRTRLLAWVEQGPRVARRWEEVFHALEAVHPAYPHWYLCTLGVEPTLTRREIGSSLLADFLEAADAFPTYLETDSYRNVGFYERMGFGVQKELELFGIPVWCMQRPAPAPRVRSPRRSEKL
jgi:ribosomal protein S18 acetylase RimI-like enzyme